MTAHKLMRIVAVMLIMAGAVLMAVSLFPGQPALGGTTWRLISVDGQPVDQVVDYSLHMVIHEEGRLSADLGCNHYRTPVRQVGRLLVTGLWQEITAVLCLDDGISSLERTLLDAYRGIAFYDVREDGRLIIKTLDGHDLVLRYTGDVER